MKKERIGLFEFSHGAVGDFQNVTISNFSGFIHIDQSDTLYYNFGYRISSLSEINPDVIYLSKETDSGLTKDSEIYFTAEPGFDREKLRKQNVTYKRIGRQVWKWTYPVDTSKGGCVGLFVDSLRIDEHEALKFNFFIDNPRTISYAKIVRIVNSVWLDTNKIKSLDFYQSTIVQ